FELKDESAAAQSFMALLADSDSHYYHYNHCVDVDDDACSTTSTDEDTFSSVCPSETTTDEAESLMDMDNDELAYLMDVLVGSETSTKSIESEFFDDRFVEEVCSSFSLA
ncbi:hypothetical protein Gpo141_00012360, partial [Globisporangium polare]